VAEGRRLDRDRAIARLVERYLDGAVFSTPRLLARLFGLPAPDVAAALARLVARGAVVERAVPGWPGRWIVRASLSQRFAQS
jgi:hypothetical protein